MHSIIYTRKSDKKDKDERRIGNTDSQEATDNWPWEENWFSQNTWWTFSKCTN